METGQFRQSGSKSDFMSITHKNDKKVMETGQYHQNESKCDLMSMSHKNY